MTTAKLSYLALIILGATLLLLSGCKKPRTVKDIDGNTYKTVKIGSQVWMAENLRTTKYNDGTPISTGHSDSEWANLTTGAYAVYPFSGGFRPEEPVDGINSNAKMLKAYGALYNWYAVETGNLCPTGWRVPTDADWAALVQHIDPNTDLSGRPESEIAGGKLKSTRSEPDTHPRWNSPNTDATDEYGFSALPGGFGGYSGSFFFFDVGNIGYWWSCTEHDAALAWGRSMANVSGNVIRGYGSKRIVVSVRCIKDQ